MMGRLAVITICLSTAGAEGAMAQQPTTASTPPQVESRDSIKDGMGKGALAGAAGMLALWTAARRSCGTGCEDDSPAGAAVIVGAYGAALGSVVGLFADLDAGRGATPGLRVGPVYSQTQFQSSLVDGRASAPGMAAAVRLSPHISLHVEFTATDGRFRPAPGTVPDVVIQNVVPPSSRRAGPQRGIEDRRVSYVFSQLVGLHPRPWGRLRLEFLAGLGVQAQENRNYYDADLPGKFHVLDFESPEMGPVTGVDAEIAIARHFVVVPMVRYNVMGDPGPSMTYGLGAHWRF